MAKNAFKLNNIFKNLPIKNIPNKENIPIKKSQKSEFGLFISILRLLMVYSQLPVTSVYERLLCYKLNREKVIRII